MNIKTTTTLADDDTEGRAFLPIRMDLVDRLTRECDCREVRIEAQPTVANVETVDTPNGSDRQQTRAT